MKEEKEKELQKAKVLAIKWLTRRSFFKAELECKLQKTGFSSDVIVDVTEFCIKIGALDDQKLLTKVVEKELRRGRGRILALSKCKRWVETAGFREMNSEAKESEKEAVRKVLQKKRIDLASLDSKGKGKILRFLLGRGFDAGIIRNVMTLSDSDE